HELVHAFHAMRFVVPAFMDWRKFWQDVLYEGGRCEFLCSNAQFRNVFVDHYGTDDELGEVMDFWPSQGKRWFEAWHPA
ncbi:MAG: hypothetical protein KAV82_10335, partial [Phycisphaerae bacterium]|nr:hypothetical protein [Phycisphaerae bacterium]